MTDIKCWKTEVTSRHILKTSALILLGAVASTGSLPLRTTAISLIVGILMLYSVMITTCVISKKNDKENRKKTPITEKKTTEKESMIIASAAFILSAMAAFTLLNMRCLALIITAQALSIAYGMLKYRYPVKAPAEGIYSGLTIAFAGFANSPRTPGLTNFILALSTLIALNITARRIAKNITLKKDKMFPKNTIAERYDNRTAAIASSSLILVAIFISIIPAATIGTTFLYIIGTADIILAYAGLRILISTEHAAESANFMKIAIILTIISFLTAAI